MEKEKDSKIGLYIDNARVAEDAAKAVISVLDAARGYDNETVRCALDALHQLSNTTVANCNFRVK